MSSTSHHGERGSVTGTRGLPAIHSSISDMMGFGHVPTGSIRMLGRTRCGPRRSSSSRRSRACRSRSLRPFEAADLAASKGVEDEGQELPGDGHPGLVATPALGNAPVVLAELLVALAR